FDADRRLALEQAALPCVLLAACSLVAVGVRLRNASDDEAFGYGSVAFFLGSSAEYYYGAGRITLALVHASNLDRPRHRAALAALLVLEAASNAARALSPGSLS